MPPDGARESIASVYENRVGGPTPVLALLREYVPGRTPVVALAVVSTVLNRVSRILPPYLLGVAVDAFFVGSGPPAVAFVPAAWVPATRAGQFAFVVGLFVAVAAGVQTTQGIRVAAWRWFQQSVLYDLRVDAFDATQRLGVAFFEAERTGDVMSVLTNDVNQLEEFLGDGLQQAIRMATVLPGLVAIMLGLHWQLTLVAFAFVPPTLAVVHAYQRVVEPRYDERRGAVGTLNAHLQNAIAGIETVKAFVGESRERSRLAGNARAYWRADWRAARVQAVFDPARGLVTSGAYIAIIVVGGWWALFGPPFGVGEPLSAGTFVTFYFYGSMFVQQSARVGDVVDGYVDAKSSAKRVFGLLYYPADTAPEATALESVEGRVAFDGVTFTYPETDTPALRDVSFAAEAGEFVGVVGPTGAGKSTVLKLLLAFYRPDSGTVCVDGHGVADLTAGSIREAIGYVGQEPFLFDGTVRQNIAYPAATVEDADVAAAAKRANAHGFVTELPEGYDTRVGERGVKLSGGQRQRIAIARAILRDPEILLLDEATSHVDNRTELLIQESLTEVVAGRTTIAVAHRLSTVRNADRILVLDDGHLTECGSHEELLAREGLYADLWGIHVGTAEAAPEGVEPGREY